MAEIKEFKEFVQIGKNTYIALGGCYNKVANSSRFYYKTFGVWHKTNPLPRNMNL